MSCNDARAAFLSGDADRAHREHLDSCAECRAELPSLEESQRILDDPSFWEEPAPEVEERLVGLIAGRTGADASRRSTARWVAAALAAVAALAAGVLLIARPSAPDWEVALPGTAEAPSAAGFVAGWNEAGGTRMALDIEGLPSAPDGFVYEFWLSAGDVHISAGTFKQTDGVELWAGVSRAEYPRLWITLEPIDDDESPSGVNVMDTG